MVLYSHLLQNFPHFIVIHTVKGFGIVNKAEIDVFVELSCFSHDPENVKHREEEEKKKICKISSERWEIRADNTEMHSIKREYNDHIPQNGKPVRDG